MEPDALDEVLRLLAAAGVGIVIGINREMHGKPLGKGSVSVIDFASGEVVKTWPIPGGGSPDMGNVSADGKYLLSGNVYDLDTQVNLTASRRNSARAKALRVAAPAQGFATRFAPQRRPTISARRSALCLERLPCRRA